jgi:hypothetical protein
MVNVEDVDDFDDGQPAQQRRLIKSVETAFLHPTEPRRGSATQYSARTGCGRWRPDCSRSRGMRLAALAEWHTADITAILRLARAGSKLTASQPKTRALGARKRSRKPKQRERPLESHHQEARGRVGELESNALGRAKIGRDGRETRAEARAISLVSNGSNEGIIFVDDSTARTRSSSAATQLWFISRFWLEDPLAEDPRSDQMFGKVYFNSAGLRQEAQTNCMTRAGILRHSKSELLVLCLSPSSHPRPLNVMVRHRAPHHSAHSSPVHACQLRCCVAQTVREAEIQSRKLENKTILNCFS